MTTTFGKTMMEQRLDLSILARELNADGRLANEDLARVAESISVKVHPLVYLAERKLPDAAKGTKRREALPSGQRRKHSTFSIRRLAIH